MSKTKQEKCQFFHANTFIMPVLKLSKTHCVCATRVFYEASAIFWENGP